MKEQIIVYVALGLAGAFAGLIRHMTRIKEYGFRSAIASAGLSVVLSIGVVGIHAGKDVVENPFAPLGYVLLIGYFQPNLSSFVSTLLSHIAGSIGTKGHK